MEAEPFGHVLRELNTFYAPVARRKLQGCRPPVRRGRETLRRRSPAHTLAALCRQLREVDHEIRLIDHARAEQKKRARFDEPWDGDQI